MRASLIPTTRPEGDLSESGRGLLRPEFQKGLAEGLRFFAANKGTYYVHCTEGKDRAGFVSALLECLMGATYDEVVADYMVTYYNYYGVEPGTDKYEAIANSNIIKTLQNAFGVEDLSKADLQKGAKDYMKAIGLTDAEITDLMVNLGYVAPVEPATPSKPATGDAGSWYLGLGVMALAGGVLVAEEEGAVLSSFRKIISPFKAFRSLWLRNAFLYSVHRREPPQAAPSTMATTQTGRRTGHGR